MKLRLAAALCAALLHAAPAAAASPLDLDFAAAPSPRLWTQRIEGSGPTLAHANGRVELDFPATSADGPTGAFAAAYDSRCTLRGNFDISLEYLLLDWPFSNGVRSGIVMGGSWAFGAVERTSFGTSADYPGYDREVYLTHMADGVNGIRATADMAGSVRLVRAGTDLIGYSAAADGWAEIHKGPADTFDMSIGLQAWSHDYAFSDLPVRLAFTGFRVNSGQVICEGARLVGVDVKPGSVANPVNLGAPGQLPVAVLSTATFDATQVNPATVRVAGAPVASLPGGRLKAQVADVNGDGHLDLLVHVEVGALQLPAGSVDLKVEGSTFGGDAVVGYDKVTLVP